ncbi:outer membrane protein assembly factor BamB [Limnohabitans sp. Rim8]|uniref:outer membrane protein assembly factor BamB n=1 Tax=Limnohabitans sp. Rim8 TaxID=1100718 RepID=UPI0026164B8E|nr:outer membrane protein assembly factor BamB [Limnohabitans sp. Rim8]
MAPMFSVVSRLMLVAAALLVGACSSAPEKPKASPLPAVSGTFKVQPVWKSQIGSVSPQLLPSVHGQQMALASSQGQLALIDVLNGRDIWRLNLNAPIQAGVGGDGRRFAVVTQANELVVAEAGKVLWRHVLPALSYTPPLVAGDRVFVMTGDRAVTAFDADTGQRLWGQQRPSDPLLLRQAGLLMPLGDNLLVGWGGRLASLNPLTGAVRWETLVGVTRGTNEVERLVDLVAGTSRQGNLVCVRSFQTAVACLDGLTGRMAWSRPAQGHQGLDGNEQILVGSESDGKVLAWQRSTGNPLWTQDALRFRGLSMPLLLNNAVVVGDQEGWLHFLSPQNGQALQRVATDSSAIMGKPIWSGQMLVVVTRTGGVHGFRPE